jgi:hypothetical protein
MSSWPEVQAQHAQHRHLLSAMMRSMRQPPRQHPGSRAGNVKKLCFFLEPALWLLAQRLQPLSAVFRIAPDEFQPRLLSRQRRRTYVNSQHGAKPQILAHALVHHLFPHAAPPPVACPRAHRQILVAEFAPNADHLYPLRPVRLHQEFVAHKKLPTAKFSAYLRSALFSRQRNALARRPSAGR